MMSIYSYKTDVLELMHSMHYITLHYITLHHIYYKLFYLNFVKYCK